jgi:glycosyltransferase involved in cell wall biosynthesis
MKVFIDLHANWNSGFETHLVQFLKNFDSHVDRDEFIFFGTNRLISNLNQLSDKATFIIDDTIPPSSKKSFYWRKTKLPALLSHYAPDIHFNLMGWMQHNNPDYIKVGMNRNLQPFLPEKAKLPSLFSKDYYRLKLYNKIILKSYNNCNGLIFNSEYARDIISPLISGNVISKVIPHGVNENLMLPPRNHTKTNDLSILYISDFYPYKNQEALISAVITLRESEKLNLKLNLIGSQDKAAAKRISQLLATIKDHTTWLKIFNKVPNDELIKHFKSNDIYVYASSVESFGHSLIEAMAAGMPIICTNKRPMSDFVRNGALLIDEKNENDIAEKILKISVNPQLRNELASISFKRSQEFSYQKMTIQTLDFLRSFK